jgi:hypothetical protein
MQEIKIPEIINIGEGLVGEAAKTNVQKCYNNLDSAYSYVSSSLGNQLSITS